MHMIMHLEVIDDFFNLWKKRAVEIHLFESKISPFESASPIWGLLGLQGLYKVEAQIL